MKEIYVYKQLIGGWKGVPKEEAETMIKEGHVFGAELEVDQVGESEPLKITLFKDLFGFFGATDEDVQELINEYFTYVEEITGIVSPA